MGRIEDTINCFRDLLTFTSKVTNMLSSKYKYKASLVCLGCTGPLRIPKIGLGSFRSLLLLESHINDPVLFFFHCLYIRVISRFEFHLGQWRKVLITVMGFAQCTLGGVKLACKDPSFAQSLVVFAN